MVITQKITSLAFEIHDGKISVCVFNVCVCVYPLCLKKEKKKKKGGRHDRSENAASILCGV